MEAVVLQARDGRLTCCPAGSTHIPVFERLDILLLERASDSVHRRSRITASLYKALDGLGFLANLTNGMRAL